MKKHNFYILAFLFFTAFIFAQEEKVITENDSIDVPFVLLDNFPIFPGCEDFEKMELDKQNECFNNKIAEHIKANFRYPSKAMRKNIQGRVIIALIINKEGDIENIKTNAPEGCEILEKEAKRIISLLPNFKPAKVLGKPVSITFAVPMNFVITK